MSSAHGAGLMLMTVFAFSMSDGVRPLDIPRYGVLHAVAIGLLAMAVHVGAMIITCGAVALAVYEVLGLRVLRSLWVNLDKVWAFALVGAGSAHPAECLKPERKPLMSATDEYLANNERYAARFNGPLPMPPAMARPSSPAWMPG